MRILALDPGSVRVGVAISDELRILATPLDYIPAEPFAGCARRIADVIREREVVQVIVGMPRNMDGSYGEAAQRSRAFVSALRDVVQVPIRTWDERLTTVQARRALRETGSKGGDRERIDSAAAAVLLQGYLDAQVS
jgi:putative Holliday junction resolvase